MGKTYRTVKIEEENYNRLVGVKGFFEQKFGQMFSLNDVIETLLDLYDREGYKYFATPASELGLVFLRRKSSSTQRGQSPRQ
ncbi:MAG: hypothetical protein QXI60_07455 [Thermofilaceae archaeon]